MTKQTWMIIGFIAFALLCSGLTLYGILTHYEPTVRSEKRWVQAPLSIAGDGSHEETLSYAVDKINTRLGFKMLRLVDSPNPDISVDFDAPYDVETWDAPGGQFRAEFQGSRYTRCEIQTSNVSSGVDGAGDLLALTLEHEIGHCLGLDHDPQMNGISIMVPELEETPRGRIPRWISDDDRSMLRDLYAD